MRPRTILVLFCAFASLPLRPPPPSGYRWTRATTRRPRPRSASPRSRMSSRRWTPACRGSNLCRQARSCPRARSTGARLRPGRRVGAFSGRIACAREGAAATTGGDTIADDDARGEDTSTEGIVGQLDAVATVLGQTNARLTGIAAFVGASPGPAEIEAAGGVWAQAASIYNRTVDLLANADRLPSPVCPAG